MPPSSKPLHGNGANPLRDILHQKEMQSENSINNLRLALWLLYSLVDSLSMAREGSWGQVVPFFLSLVFDSVITYLIIRRFTADGVYRPVVKYVTITIDFMVIPITMAMYQEKGIFSTLTTPDGLWGLSVLLFTVLTIVGSIRYSHSAILYSGVLALLCTFIMTAMIQPTPLLRLYGTIFIIIVAALIYINSRGYRQVFIRMQQREFLTRFMSPEIVTGIDRGDISLELGGEERLVTVLLSDIRGFTTMAETMKPAELVDLLNRYLSRMTDIVFEHGGTLDKFIGDAVLAVYGLPVSKEDDALRALQTAEKMITVLEELNRELKKEGKPELHIGIGLHTGAVVAGKIGSPQRMEYTVIGDTVNLASRIESMNKEFDTQILMTEDTYERVKSEFTGKMIAETPVRGRQGMVKLYGR